MKKSFTLFVLFCLLHFYSVGSEIVLTQNRINKFIDQAEELFKNYFYDWTTLLVENQIDYTHKTYLIKDMLGYFENHKKLIINDLQFLNLFMQSYTIEDYLNKVAVAIENTEEYNYTTNYAITRPIEMYKDNKSDKYYFYIFYNRDITQIINEENNPGIDNKILDSKSMILEIFTINGADFYIEKFGPDNGTFNPLTNGLEIVKPQSVMSNALISCNASQEQLTNIERLKMDLDKESINSYQQILNSIKQSRTSYAMASGTIYNNFQKSFYDHLNENLLKLKGKSAAVDGEIQIFVDTTGKLIEYKESLKSYDRIENYNSLKETIILPYLKKNKLQYNIKEYESPDTLYKRIYSKYKKEIDLTPCPEKFNEILSMTENRFKSITKLRFPQNTVYHIPLKFSFSNHDETWKLYKKRIVNNVTKEEITDTALLKDFYSKVKKPKNGIYDVTISNNSMLDSPETVEIKELKSKYKYYTHLGFTSSMLIPIKNKVVNFELKELFTYNAFLIYHKIGFFGGSVFRNKKVEDNVKTEGLYIDDIDLYFEAGLLIGIAQYFYLKAGYAHLKTSLAEFEESVLVSTIDNKVNYGFLAGLSLIFPYVHFEGGYNYSFRAPYASLGLNIPINR